MGQLQDALKPTASQVQPSSALGWWMRLVSEAGDAGSLAVLGQIPYGNSAQPVGTVSSGGASFFVSRADHVHAHGDQAGGSLHAIATGASAGFMSAADKTTFDALVAGGPYVPASRQVIAGDGMTGGGDLSADRTFNIVAADGSIAVGANSIAVGVISDAQHGNRSGGALHAIATGASAGFMSAADKNTLDSLAALAVPNTRTLTAGAGLTGGGDLSADRTFNVGQNADGSVVVNANDIQVAAAIQSGASAGATAVQPARTLTAGAGLTGGGDLTADRTFNIGQNADNSIVVNANDIQVAAAIQSGASAGATAVQPARTLTAGAGLTGGGDLSADRTFDVGADDASIIVSATGIRINDAIYGSPLSSSSIGQAPGAIGLIGRSLRYGTPNPAAATLSVIGTTFTQTSSGTTAGSLASSDLRQSSVRTQLPVNCDNISCLRGSVPKVGGFFWAWRIAFPQMLSDTRILIGFSPASIGANNPSAVANTMGFACDTGDTDISIITVNNAGTATKTSIGSFAKTSLATGDPNSTFARVIEWRIYAAPNASDVTFYAYDWSNETTLVAPTAVSATLPLNTTFLRPQAFCSSGPTGGQNTLAFIHAYGYS